MSAPITIGLRHRSLNGRRISLHSAPPLSRGLMRYFEFSWSLRLRATSTPPLQIALFMSLSVGKSVRFPLRRKKRFVWSLGDLHQDEGYQAEVGGHALSDRLCSTGCAIPTENPHGRRHAEGRSACARGAPRQHGVAGDALPPLRGQDAAVRRRQPAPPPAHAVRA